MVDKFKLARKAKIEAGKRNTQKALEDNEDLKPRVQRTKSLINESVEDWKPKTELGRKVKDGDIRSLDEIFDKNYRILEPLIVDSFIPELKEFVIDTKKTSYVRMSGRKYNFRCTVLVGDGSKFVGVGTAKDTDKWNAIRKAARKARLSVVRVKRGSGTWESKLDIPNSIPKTVEGKCGSVRVRLMSAPPGVGLVVADAIKPVFEFVGIRDVWSKSFGSTSTTLNFVKATIEALRKTY